MGNRGRGAHVIVQAEVILDFKFRSIINTSEQTVFSSERSSLTSHGLDASKTIVVGGISSAMRRDNVNVPDVKVRSYAET